MSVACKIICSLLVPGGHWLILHINADIVQIVDVAYGQSSCMSVAHKIICILFIPGMVGLIDFVFHHIHSRGILLNLLLGIYRKVSQLILIMLHRLQIAKEP